MSWSLQLRNGDLFHHQGHYAKIEGPSKVAQDVRVAILTRMGEDQANPWYGSVIDGGTWTDGTQIPSVIGRLDFDQVANEVSSELRRIESAYKERQASRIHDDTQTYGRTTLRRDEILRDLDAEFTQVQDTLLVSIRLSFMDGTPEIIEVPLVTI